MENNDYIDFDQAVAFLRTTPSTLYKWLQSGKIPGHKLGRQWRFLREELEIHVSGVGSKINIQRDFQNLNQLLISRSKNKEKKVDLNTSSIPENVIWDAFDHGSRVIHIYPAKGKYEISYRTKAGMEKLSEIHEESFAAFDDSLSRISTAIDDGSARRLYLHREDGDPLQVKYQKVETVTGSRLTLQIWQTEKDVLPLEKINSGDKKALENFKIWLARKSGILLVSGTNGSGKTTTIYSLMNEFKKQGRVVFSIEDSTDLIIEGINQIEVKGRADTQFEKVFEKVYGSDPDVICLGLGSILGLEEQVFNAAFRAASAGHLVLIQMNQASCKEALDTFKKYVPYPVDQLVAGVSCQRLVEEGGKVKASYEFLYCSTGVR